MGPERPEERAPRLSPRGEDAARRRLSVDQEALSPDTESACALILDVRPAGMRNNILLQSHSAVAFCHVAPTD